MKTYKDLVLAAQALITAHLAGGSHPEACDDADLLGKLVALFDGPEQRAVLACDTPEENFIAAWRAYSEITYGVNVSKGFMVPGEPCNIDRQMFLIVSEVVEGHDAIRNGDTMDDKLPHRKGAEVELGDAVLRIMNFAKHQGYDVAAAIIEKTTFNANRPHLHGKAF